MMEAKVSGKYFLDMKKDAASLEHRRDTFQRD